MKILMWLLVVVVILSPLAAGQTLLSDKVWVKHYGTASFIGDSVFVTTSNANWVTVTISYDTSAGTTVAYFCKNNDSTQAQPLLPPATAGSYGDSFSWDVFGLKFFRVKGAVPVTVRIVPKI